MIYEKQINQQATTFPYFCPNEDLNFYNKKKKMNLKITITSKSFVWKPKSMQALLLSQPVFLQPDTHQWSNSQPKTQVQKIRYRQLKLREKKKHLKKKKEKLSMQK